MLTDHYYNILKFPVNEHKTAFNIFDSDGNILLMNFAICSMTKFRNVKLKVLHVTGNIFIHIDFSNIT